MGANSGQHREIEVKLDASAGFRLPPLDDLPGVVRVVEEPAAELDAVYLDSPDLRLARHDTTLRRRLGGTDAGWHLKLPVAQDERLEVRRAPGRSEKVVPPALRGLVAVHLRGAPLEPVARISTRRAVYRLVGADDVVLAEVSDDAVTAEALGDTMTTDTWREIEVELVDGDKRVLSAARKALARSGARPSDAASKVQRILGPRLKDLARLNDLGGAASPNGAVSHNGSRRTAKRTAGDVVVGYLAAQIRELTATDPAVKLDAEESVHDMRVATRRLRTVLAAFRPLFADGAVEPLREELKWLGGELGAVRDADVLLETLRRQLAEQPAELVVGPVARRIDLELGAQRKQARARLLETLTDPRYFALLGELEGFLAHPPFDERAAAPADKELRRLVSKACRRVRRAEAALDELPSGPDRDHQLHRVRIAAKRVRYAAETAEDVAGKDAAKLVDAMKEVQDLLGGHQDDVVQRQVLRDLAMRAFLSGENSFTLGRLHGLAESRAARHEAAFLEAWKDIRKRMAAWPG